MKTWTDKDLGEGRLAVDGRRKWERKDGFTSDRRATFLNRLSETCCVRRAIEACGACPSSVYAARRRDGAFADAWQEALTVGYDTVEAKLLRYVVSEGGEQPEGGPESGEGAAPAAPADGAAAASDRVPAWVQVALKLLDRHRAAVEGRGQPIRSGQPASAEQTDVALTRRLDLLARNLARAKPGGAGS